MILLLERMRPNLKRPALFHDQICDILGADLGFMLCVSRVGQPVAPIRPVEFGICNKQRRPSVSIEGEREILHPRSLIRQRGRHHPLSTNRDQPWAGDVTVLRELQPGLARTGCKQSYSPATLDVLLDLLDRSPCRPLHPLSISCSTQQHPPASSLQNRGNQKA